MSSDCPQCAALRRTLEDRNARIAVLSADNHFVDSAGGRFLPCSKAIAAEIAYFQRRAEAAELALRQRTANA